MFLLGLVSTKAMPCSTSEFLLLQPEIAIARILRAATATMFMDLVLILKSPFICVLSQ
jgi:hypothetical protein